MKYNWDIKDIKKARNELRLLYLKEKDKMKREFLESVLNKVEIVITEEQLDDRSSKVIYNYKERLRDMESSFITYEDDYELVSTFHSIIAVYHDKIDTLDGIIEEKIGLDSNYGKITGAKISNDEAMSLTNLFYKKHMKSLYPIFKMFYANRGCSVRFKKNLNKDVMADSFYIPFLDRYFINCLKSKDITKAFNLIHEYGHIIYSYINPQEFYNPRYFMFSELSAIFPELVAYYENDNNFDETQLLFELYLMMTSFYGHSTQLVLHKPVISLWHSHKEQLSKKFFKELDYFYDTDRDLFDSLLDTYIDDQGAYIISYMAAIELLHIYKRDKRKALKLFEDILRLPYEENLFMFINQELKLGENLEEEVVSTIDKLTLALKRGK